MQRLWRTIDARLAGNGTRLEVIDQASKALDAARLANGSEVGLGQSMTTKFNYKFSRGQVVRDSLMA